MSKRLPTMEELVSRPVIRQLIDSEWMSKLSSAEFKLWVETEKSTYVICRVPEHEHDAKLQQQIEFKEMEYDMRKKQLMKPYRFKKTSEKTVQDHTQEILDLTDTNIQLGGDLASNPSTRDALIAITGTTKTNKNGRVYKADLFDLKGIKKSNRLNGVFNHPNIVRWDNYEKHVKKYGI